MTNPFADFQNDAWPYRFNGTLHIPKLVGGVPTNEKVAEGWLRTKLADKDDLIRQMVAETMVERGVDGEQATAIVDAHQHLNGFKRDDNGLYIEGRQLKAAIKEATSVANAAGKLKPPNGKKGWGTTNKGLLGFIAEHVMVVEDRLHLHEVSTRNGLSPIVREPAGILQRFVHTHRGSAIQYEEYVEDVEVHFTVVSDYEFTPKDWAMIWLTGEQQGLGASRSQGFGRYRVTRWELATK